MMSTKKAAGSSAAWKWVFWIYLLLLILFVVIKFHGSISALLRQMEEQRGYREVGAGSYLNLTPFVTIKSQLRHLPAPWAVRNLVGNVLCFIPFGLLLPLAHRHLRTFFRVMLLALVMICAIEVFQYVTCLGSCDVDDLILNLLGCLAGWLCWLPLKRGS